jgi:uncharacterized protein
VTNNPRQPSIETHKDHCLCGCLPSLTHYRLANRCLEPSATPVSELENAAWAGINPENWWDCHTHIVGSGDSGSGIFLHAAMQQPLRHPIQTLLYKAYANAACTGETGDQDHAFVERIVDLMDNMPKGAKAMLFAFDRVYDANGTPDDRHTSFYVPNQYAMKLAKRFPEFFEWVASVHPYRKDCIAELERCRADGARAIKWLPSSMGIDPADPKCERFYQAAARLNLPIISHGGEEKSVHGANQQAFSNPLRLERALNAGVRIIIAHCATLGKEKDEQGKKVRNFDIFARLMSENQWQGQLFGDISAITLRNRDLSVIKTLLSETSWHSRLLNGSDYPLPGVLPLISVKSFVKAGMLAQENLQPLLALQDHHPFRFDFVLKRSLAWQGHRFADSIFETRSFFTNNPQ